MSRAPMLYVDVNGQVVGKFPTEEEARKFATAEGGDLIDPILDPAGGTPITSVEDYLAGS